VPDAHKASRVRPPSMEELLAKELPNLERENISHPREAVEWLDALGEQLDRISFEHTCPLRARVFALHASRCRMLADLLRTDTW
jgi:hypothetical protein